LDSGADMPGLLDDQQLLGLLQGAGLLSGSSSSAPAQTLGLLGQGWKPDPNEGLLTRLFGDAKNPNDPRGDAMAQIGLGLMRRDPAGGMAGALQTFNDYQDRSGKRAANALSLGKTALEYQALKQAQDRNQAIQQERTRMRAAQQFQSLPTSSDSFGVPTAGDTPLFSMGSQPTSAAPMAGVPQPAGPTHFGGGSETQRVYQQLLQEADLYGRYGDTKTANDLYQRAAQFRPKFSTTPQLMKDPRTGQLVQVVANEEGGYQILPFGAKPDIAIEDLGGRKVAVDRNATSDGRTWEKSMTPGESAGNRVAWANYGVSRDRLNFDKSQPEYREVNGQLFAIPRASDPGIAPTGRVVSDSSGAPLGGDMPRLTEFQGKATTFATRMRDASRVIDAMEGKSWPSTVNRAGYQADFPNWMPANQAIGGALTAVNNAFVPGVAQQAYQAQQNWVTANLRQESGAAIGRDEMEKEIRKWFPQAGDGAEVIQQKAEARKVAQEAMLAQAGPGAKLVQQTLDRADAANAQRGGAKPVPLPSTNVKDLTNGTLYTLPNGKVGRWNGLTRKFEVQ
jgi:hypothetical protein